METINNQNQIQQFIVVILRLFVGCIAIFALSIASSAIIIFITTIISNMIALLIYLFICLINVISYVYTGYETPLLRTIQD